MSLIHSSTSSFNTIPISTGTFLLSGVCGGNKNLAASVLTGLASLQSTSTLLTTC